MTRRRGDTGTRAGQWETRGDESWREESLVSNVSTAPRFSPLTLTPRKAGAVIVVNSSLQVEACSYWVFLRFPDDFLATIPFLVVTAFGTGFVASALASSGRRRRMQSMVPRRSEQALERSSVC